MLHVRTCFLVFTCSLFATAQPPAAEEVLSALEAATGTNEARAKITTLAAKGHVAAAMMPGKGDLEEVFVGFDRAKQSVSLEGLGSSTMGITPTETWSTDPAMGVAVESGKAGGSTRRLFGILRRTPWNKLYASAKTLGERSVKKRACWELEMTAADGTKEKWFVDQEKSHLARFDCEVPDMMGGSMKVRFYFSDWRPQAGVLFPFKRSMTVNLMKVSFEWTALEVNPKINDERIAPGDKVRAEITKKGKSSDTAPKSTEPGVCGLVQREEIHVATIRVTVPAKDISRTLAVILPEVGRHVQKHGGVIAGPPFSRYHSLGDKIDIEAGIAVAKPIKEEGRVKARKLPGGRVASVWHVGRYHELPKSYDILREWIKEKKLESRGAFWELYWTDPGIEPDPKKWKTQIFWPVK